MAANPLMAQDESVADSTSLPGDNFSLGALALFEKQAHRKILKKWSIQKAM
jgi:hypothetical protein